MKKATRICPCGGRIPSKGQCSKCGAGDRRASSAKRGYGRRWQRARAEFLRVNPWCVECEPKPVLATVVDHIIPHRGDDRLFWDVNNWQPLCKRHHDAKTAKGE